MARTSSRRRAAKLMAKPSGSTMVKGNPDDRISSLPNDILVNILNRLDVRAATRTSVLSRRWSQLPAMVPQLTISARDLLPSETKTSISKAEIVRRTTAAVAKDPANAAVSDAELVRRTSAAVAKALADAAAVAKALANAAAVAKAVANTAVAKMIKSILARRDPGGWPIRLSMTFYLRDGVPISVGHTVGNAMATLKVEKAEFTVLTEKKGRKCSIDDVVNYGTRFVSFFNECHNAFAGLTRLYLENLRFRESNFVSNILVTCKQLNYLGFFNCDTEDWITLQVEHAQLIELSIVNCRFDMVKLTWVPKLTCLVFLFWLTSREPPLALGYVPLLEVLRLSNAARSLDKMLKLSTFLHETSVRDLTLGFQCEKIWVQPECLTRRQAYVFQQLRILNLVKIPEGYDLTWTMFFLEAAPSLEELYMTVWDHPCEMEMNQEIRREQLYSENKGVEWESPTSNFKHHCLAKFILVGFQAKDYMVSHVRRVLKAAVNLQDVYLYDRLVCAKCQEKVKNARRYDALVRCICPGVNLPIKFPCTNEDQRAVQKRMPRGIGSLAKIHFLSSNKIKAEHWPRIAVDSLGAIED
ncbi:uncharacterized protein [Aegilops tauschii subsp. strangulata]|uniref:F-box domain-containing protein n=5 Tax=Triticinae TaxID=1648030 RepID=A0A453Q555_AEGTS|nr:uncharacterized protein LOC109753050 [Aegilops tauschii subsp. strangulata]XP_020167568.1 uncharacterized protein LOC109753050 [Aegilops tauschii subsp. strangulata]XP_044421833.1 uncharacterized protein LOC123146276 [Triticum aestivum]XP_044421834.1 uncharacterized protein LOC123146276 [Triticum aestivum]